MYGTDDWPQMLLEACVHGNRLFVACLRSGDVIRFSRVRPGRGGTFIPTDGFAVVSGPMKDLPAVLAAEIPLRALAWIAEIAS